MSNSTPTPADAGDQARMHDLSATDEFAKIREVMRASEKHREGGIDPELLDDDAEPEP